MDIKRIIGSGKRFAAERMSKPAEPEDDVRITNETVAARREEVLGSARKFIYPLGAPRHRVVKWSVAILIAVVVGFFVFCVVDLYHFQPTSSFMYGVTEVIPFPVAMIGTGHFVPYNDYLFELRRYMHYETTQQHVDFTSKQGREQLAVFKKRSMQQALDNAYVERLAEENGVSVSEQDVDRAIAVVRTQNRLGASDDVFENVLNEFWGWSIGDFRRELRHELLAQKVVDKLDAQTHQRANQAYAALQQGADFATLAKQVSDDAQTKANGGDYGINIDQSNTQLPPEVVSALFKLDIGHYSTIINTGYSLEIVKLTQVQGGQAHAAHMSFNFQPATTYIKRIESVEKTHQFIHV